MHMSPRTQFLHNSQLHFAHQECEKDTRRQSRGLHRSEGLVFSHSCQAQSEHSHEL
jgi:hypothetical protein